jgi:threonine dehydrogenase-like Zn-dependent dehydrogenase
MKAIAVVPGTTQVRLVDRPEPAIGAPGEVKLKIVRVGICGTDRDEAAGGRAQAPADASDLVMGHEMLGQVVEVGAAVKSVRAGDYAVFTVRRGCDQCLPCVMNRPDMCRTGNYRERGIRGLDGYQCEYVVDQEAYLVRVPAECAAVGVLTEPMSVAVKAIEEAAALQAARLPDAPATPNWLHGRRCLVAGLGPIGLLAALALRLRGAEVFGMDVVDAATARPRWLAAIGGSYVDGRQIAPGQLEAKYGGFELIFEATGIAALEFALLDALAVNGAYVLTGIPMGDRPVPVAGAELMRRMVLRNQVMLGSVNAARDHYQTAVDDLDRARLTWSGLVERLITNRYRYADFAEAFAHHGAEEIKVVVEWS